MPGLFLTIQAHARRISGPLLLVYLLLLPLLAFGHQCGEGLTGTHSAAAAAVHDGGHFSHDSGDASSTGHDCAACTAQRHLAATAPEGHRLVLPSAEYGASLLASSPAPRTGSPLLSPPRGPPAS